MTGLEVLNAIKEGKIPAPSISQTMPMNIISVEFGCVTFEATADKRHLNPLGFVHGGFAATVLDSVTGCAVHSTLDSNVGYATIDFNIKMLKKIPLGETLIAKGNTIKTLNQLGFAEATLKDSKGNLYAHATATCIIQKPKSE